MSWQAGTLVGNRYELRVKLSGGGMADVWIVRDVTKDEYDYNAPVVLKCLNQDLQVTGLLFQEFKHVISLHHANIIKVFEVGEHDGLHYIVMEYLRGKDMSRVIARVAERTGQGVHPSYIAFVAWIIGQVCQALTCAHSDRDAQGVSKSRIIHRDISPQNIVLMLDGGVKLIDFGIARALEEFSILTRSPIWGKTLYMPPEQWLNRGMNQRSDIFSLGVVMFDLLTGDNLFNTRKTATERPRDLETPIIRKPSESSRFPIPDEAMGLAKCLDVIVLKALQIDPEERFPSAGVMAEQIHFALRDNGYDRLGRTDLADFFRGLFQDELKDLRRWPEGLHANFFKALPEKEQVLVPPRPKVPLPPAWLMIAVSFIVLLGWTGLMLASRRQLKLEVLPKIKETLIAQPVVQEPGPAPAAGRVPATLVPKPSRPHRRPVANSKLHPGALETPSWAEKLDAGSKAVRTCPLNGQSLAEVRDLLKNVKNGVYNDVNKIPHHPLVSAVNIPEDLKSAIEKSLKAALVVCAATDTVNMFDPAQAALEAYSLSASASDQGLSDDPQRWCKAKRIAALASINTFLQPCNE